jgi:molybdate transport system substrate-binding protein
MNGRSKRATTAAVVCLNLLIAVSSASAAEIAILSSRNVQPEMDAIIPAFERSSGHKVAISYAATPEFIDRFNKGPQIDMAILFTETMDRFLATTKISVGSRFDILQSDIGAVVRAGAPKPDVSSIAALKNTLLAAKSIAFSQGPTGVYMATVVQDLGIAVQLKPKTILTDSGIGAVGKAVADSKAEIGIHGTYELLSVPGIDFVGPIPGELQKMMVYSAIIPTEAKEGGAAKTLARFLSSETAIPLIRQKGMEPIAVR